MRAQDMNEILINCVHCCLNSTKNRAKNYINFLLDNWNTSDLIRLSEYLCLETHDKENILNHYMICLEVLNRRNRVEPPPVSSVQQHPTNQERSRTPVHEVRTRPRSVTPEPRPPPQTPPPRPVRPIRYPRPLNTRIRYLMDDDDDDVEEGEVVENTGFLRYGNTRILTRGSILVTKLAKIEKTECPICFEFDSNSQLGCCHTFCKTCIFKHASNKIDSCCPMCRDPIKKIAVLYEDFENIVFPNNHFVKLSETST